MAYSEIEQTTSDINWYFTDQFNRICIAASAGGLLPKIIAENDEKNDQFHKVVIESPSRYKVVRNENMLEFITGVKPDNLDEYFKDFENLASRGLYVFDKLKVEDPEDGNYILVAYPMYNTKTDSVPLASENLKLIPRLNRTIITRFNQEVKPSSFNPINLVDIINKLK
jgi:hypothetical protein